MGSISFGITLVAGNTRVPSPAAGITALRTFFIQRILSFFFPEGQLAAIFCRACTDGQFPGQSRVEQHPERILVFRQGTSPFLEKARRLFSVAHESEHVRPTLGRRNS